MYPEAAGTAPAATAMSTALPVALEPTTAAHNILTSGDSSSHIEPGSSTNTIPAVADLQADADDPGTFTFTSTADSARLGATAATAVEQHPADSARLGTAAGPAVEDHPTGSAGLRGEQWGSVQNPLPGAGQVFPRLPPTSTLAAPLDNATTQLQSVHAAHVLPLSSTTEPGVVIPNTLQSIPAQPADCAAVSVTPDTHHSCDSSAVSATADTSRKAARTHSTVAATDTPNKAARSQLPGAAIHTPTKAAPTQSMFPVTSPAVSSNVDRPAAGSQKPRREWGRIVHPFAAAGAKSVPAVAAGVSTKTRYAHLLSLCHVLHD